MKNDDFLFINYIKNSQIIQQILETIQIEQSKPKKKYTKKTKQ
jgi:hypothetical protein